VAVAQQHQVLQLGQAEVAPVVDVVGVAPGDLAVAAGEPAPTITNGDSAEQIDRHRTGSSPVVQHGVAGTFDAVDHTITQQRIGGVRGDRGVVAGPGDRRRRQGVGVDHEFDVWPLAGRARPGVVGR
jgi:hypothetical protein